MFGSSSKGDASDPDNEKLGEGKDDFKGPGDNRKCTDVLCLILLVAMWFSMTILGLTVTGVIDLCGELNSTSVGGIGEATCLRAGNPYRLLNGLDYNGNICGVDNRDYAESDAEVAVSVLEFPACSPFCDMSSREKIYYVTTANGVCIEKCPTETAYDEFHCLYEIDVILGALDAVVDEQEIAAKHFFYAASFQCLNHIASKDVLNYCVAEAVIDAGQVAAAAAVEGALDQYNLTDIAATMTNMTLTVTEGEDEGWFKGMMSDLFAQSGVIIGFGAGVAMVLGFVYIWFLRLPGVLFVMIWGIIAGVQLCLLGLGGMFWLQAAEWEAEEEPKSKDDSEILLNKIGGGFFLACAVIWFLTICCLRKRIMLALGIVKEAGRAVGRMPLLMLYPVFQTLATIIFLVPWCTYAVYLASSASLMTASVDDEGDGFSAEDLTTPPDFVDLPTPPPKIFVYTENTQLAGWYLLFCWFWTSQFIIAMGQIVVAMAISTWYFSRDKKADIGNKTVFKSIKDSMWYHSGTASFGALLIAIIKMIRAVIAYLQKKAKKSGNKLAQAVLCAIQCCMWCIEKCMKFLNKNAYIQTAIFGYSFCKAARKAFFLILRNILRIAGVSLVGDFVLGIGKLLIPLLTTFLAYSVIAGDSDNLNGIWAPVLIVLILSWFTMSMFNEVYGMAIWTILQCYIADEEMFPPEKRFAEGSLSSCVKKTNEDVDAAEGGKAKVYAASPQKEEEKAGQEELP